MKNSKDIKLLNVANENGLLPLIIGELISAEALTSEDACDKSIEILTGFLTAIDDTDIEDKDKWKDLMEKGLEVAKQDKERFAEKKKRQRRR